MADAEDYYIVSVKHTRRQNHYITLWRPDNNGYAWPLCWAGRYTRALVMEQLDYYNTGYSDIAVPCTLVDGLAVPPEPGLIDGDAGPVVPNNGANWRLLIANAIQEPPYLPRPEYKGARRIKGKVN